MWGRWVGGVGGCGWVEGLEAGPLDGERVGMGCVVWVVRVSMYTHVQTL